MEHAIILALSFERTGRCAKSNCKLKEVNTSDRRESLSGERGMYVLITDRLISIESVSIETSMDTAYVPRCGPCVTAISHHAPDTSSTLDDAVELANFLIQNFAMLIPSRVCLGQYD